MTTNIINSGSIQNSQIQQGTGKGCICEGNWRNIIKESESLFGRVYKDVKTGEPYVFFGVVWAEDDFYYLMSGLNGKTRYLSCVVSIENFGFELTEEEVDGYEWK